jgi:hypothetical protein
LTRDTRRILASCSGVRGCASGSDNAAATTSSSVMDWRAAVDEDGHYSFTVAL